jgi:hypothetical protein
LRGTGEGEEEREEGDEVDGGAGHWDGCKGGEGDDERLLERSGGERRRLRVYERRERARRRKTRKNNNSEWQQQRQKALTKNYRLGLIWRERRPAGLSGRKRVVGEFDRRRREENGDRDAKMACSEDVSGELDAESIL